MMPDGLVFQTDFAVLQREAEGDRSERLGGGLEVVPLLRIALRHHEPGVPDDVFRTFAAQGVVASLP